MHDGRSTLDFRLAKNGAGMSKVARFLFIKDVSNKYNNLTTIGYYFFAKGKKVHPGIFLRKISVAEHTQC